MKLEKYLNKLKEAQDYFVNEYGYEIVIFDKDLLRKVFSVVEKIREKITLKHYNLVVVEFSFDLGERNTLSLKFSRKYKSLIFDQLIKQNFSTEENKISVFISFTKGRVYESDFLNGDIGVVKEILNFYKIERYKQISTPYSEVIRFSIPIKSEVIKYIIWRTLDSWGPSGYNGPCKEAWNHERGNKRKDKSGYRNYLR